MTGNVRQTPPEPTCGTLWVTSDNSPTRDGTGPQNAPEGTVDMNSIDNLREYALTAASVNATTRAVLAGYVDEIEREVEELRDRDYRNGREDAKGAVEFADRLCRASERREDVTLWGVDYMPNPLDADGKPIHVGDVMENIVCPPVHREVTGVGVECFYGWDDGNGRYSQFGANCYRHHHAPTVEDVLREFTDEVWNRYCNGTTASDSGIRELEAEYAAKLRLAGEDA